MKATSVLANLALHDLVTLTDSQKAIIWEMQSAVEKFERSKQVFTASLRVEFMDKAEEVVRTFGGQVETLKKEIGREVGSDVVMTIRVE